MPDLRLELSDDDLEPLLERLGGAIFANLSPGVAPTEVTPRSGLGQLFGNRGPFVPLATWTPGEIGLQHAAGQRAARLLAERGCAVPEAWYVVSDNPKRGLVVRTYNATPRDAIGWLMRAAAMLCPVPITGPWVATVRTR